LLFPPARVWLVSKVVSRLMTTARFSPQGGLHGFGHDSRVQPEKSEPDVIEGVNYKRED